MAPTPGRLFHPKYLDISAEEGAILLKQLELEAYAGIISALRSQGDLTKEKKILLSEVCACLGISGDRHRAEIRRAVNDQKLATVALHNCGFHSDREWLKEGRRLVQLSHRPLEVTAYMEEADRVADIIAKENATLPRPSVVELGKFFKKSSEVVESPEKPVEMRTKICAKSHSLCCVKCLSELSEVADACTSTNDLNYWKKDEGSGGVLQQVPSASDSYVFLPSGTTVRISAGKPEKEEHDAYSLSTNMAGNFDFGNAPEISLTGSRSNKRKRKKSGSTAQTKESIVIRQVIRPRLLSGDDLYPNREQGTSDVTYEDCEGNHSKEKAVRHSANAELKKRLTEDDSASEHQTPKSKRKKQVSQAVTVQHTPVPPEHLYAVGATKPKRRQTVPAYAERNDHPSTHRAMPEYPAVNVVEQLPTSRHGAYSRYSNPLSSACCTGGGSIARSGSPPLSSERTVMPPSSRDFRYSPMKPFYQSPSVGQTIYGRSSKAAHSKKHRALSSTFPFAKRLHQTDVQHQSIFKKMSSRKNESAAKKLTDDFQQNKMYQSPGLYQPPLPKSSNTFVLPAMEGSFGDCSSRPSITLSQSSSLEELASVSLMASALCTSTMVETGLAPVSAIVSRVTSPAPGPISTASSVERPSTVLRPVTAMNAQSEEGTQPAHFAKVSQASFGGQEWSAFTSRHGPAALVSVSPGTAKLNVGGNLSSPHPLARQVRLAVTSTDNATITSVPISFTSVLPHTISSPVSSQMPRVISTSTGKAHTLLKSSSGNVITVTANPFPGMKSSVPTIVSGGSIVKPQTGQKTSIIVVHKTPGTKVGKAVSANFPTLGVEGSKVITVSTKNISGSPLALPRLSTESVDKSSSESALGSIQGLVSGLSPAGIVKRGKVVGIKPKYITMPIHKKPSKIIPNVIRAPGKVLVKATSGSTLTTSQLRTIPTSHIVKPIPGTIPLTDEKHSMDHDIVAAALSQSLGSSVVRPLPEVSASPEAETANEIKLATSTPAASTIKAFAATYQKNSSTSQQQKEIYPVHSSITTVSPSVFDKTEVLLANSPSRAQPMIFTPNQPQVHRLPISSCTMQARANGASGSALPGAMPPSSGTVANLAKSHVKVGPMKVVQQLASQHSIMQVKVVSQQPTTLSHNAARATVSKDTATLIRAVTTKPQPSNPTTISAGNRATFIYQYHPTPKLGAKTGPAISSGTVPGDVITLHSVNSEVPATESDRDATTDVKPPKLVSNLVKINLSCVRAVSPATPTTSTAEQLVKPTETDEAADSAQYSKLVSGDTDQELNSD